MPRVLLISYAGYPYTPSSLMPDNGLANLAGALLQNGHDVKVLDLGTVSTIRSLISPEHNSFLEKTYDQLMLLKEKNKLTKALHGYFAIRQLKAFETQLLKYQEAYVDKLAQDISDLVKKEHYDMVGFKIYVGDGFTGSAKIARAIKRNNPNVLVVGGGPTVDLVMETIFEVEPAFDVLSFAEGEEIISILADYSRGKGSLQNIPNIIFKDNGSFKQTQLSRVQDLSKLPEPIYDPAIYPAMAGDEKIKIVVFDESRGCPNACSFCAQPTKSGKQRLRNPADVVDVLEKIILKNNVRAFRYGGSSTPYAHMKNIAQEIMKRNLKIIYSSYGHVREEFNDFKMLKESGLSTLLIGIESGSQLILDKLNKGNLTSQIATTFTKCRDAGIHTVGSTIIPLPGETKETIEETFNLLTALRPDSVFLSFPGLYPRTGWANNPEKYGFEVDIKQYEKFALSYKLKTLYPPSLWNPLPYKLDGRSFNQIAKITETFGSRLEKAGIVTRMTDDIVVTAKVLNRDLNDFKNEMSKAIYIGNAEKVGEIAHTFNNKTAHGAFECN